MYKMKSFGKQVPWQNADVACSRVQSGFVNLARNARRLASPRQAHDASDVVLAPGLISMACVKFVGVIS